MSHRAEDQASDESEGLSMAPVPITWLGDSLTHSGNDTPTKPGQGGGGGDHPPGEVGCYHKRNQKHSGSTTK